MNVLGRAWAAIREARRIRALHRAAQHHRLADVPENVVVRVSGTIAPLDGEVLTAPLTDRPCVYYGLEIVGVPGGKRRIREERSIPFIIEDEGVHAAIDPARARFTVALDHESRSLAAFDASPRQLALLERHDLVTQNWWSIDFMWYGERALRPGQRITVFGAAVREPDPDARRAGGYREGARTWLRFVGTRKFPLHITNETSTKAT